MNLLRPLLVVLFIAIPVWISLNFVPHHTGDNVFSTLYMHLVPAPLEHVDHGEGHGDEHAGEGAHGATTPDYLVAIPLPHLPGPLAYVATNHAAVEESHEAPVLAMTNLQLFQIASVLILITCLSGVPKYVRTGKGDAISRLFAGFAMYIRDEMVYPVMGKEIGRKFLPYFLFVFFFLFFINLLGLVPGSATATASIFVTAAMAVTTFCAMVGCGMVIQGPVAFWKNLVPHVPLPFVPLLFVVEAVGLFIKPFALMVRLFANMAGGHLVVLSIMGLIFLFAELAGPVGGYGASPLAVGFGVFIMIIEFFVAMLQAYIFTQLSIIFVGASVHPEH